MSKMEEVVFSRIGKDLKEKLKFIANRQKISLSKLIRQITQEYLQNHEND